MYGEWDFHRLSSVTDLDQVLSKPQLPWTLAGLSRNPKITIDFIRAFSRLRGVDVVPSGMSDAQTDAPDQWDWIDVPDQWDWDEIGAVIDPVEILLHPDLPWSRWSISRNPKLSIALIDRLDQCVECFATQEGNSSEWNWGEISLNAKMVDVSTHPDRPWVLTGWRQNLDLWRNAPEPIGLSANPRLTGDVIVLLQRNFRRWSFELISRTININEVLEHPELPWDPVALISNPGINPRIVFELEDDIDFGYEVEDEEVRRLVKDVDKARLWRRHYLSHNPDLTLDFMLWFDSNFPTYDDPDDPNDIHGTWDIGYLTGSLPIGEIVDGRRDYDWYHPYLAQRTDLIEAIRVAPEWVLELTRLPNLDIPNIRLADVYRRPELPWRREWLSGIPDLTPEDMRRLDAMVGVRQQRSPIGRLQPNFGSGFGDFSLNRRQ